MENKIRRVQNPLNLLENMTMSTILSDINIPLDLRGDSGEIAKMLAGIISWSLQRALNEQGELDVQSRNTKGDIYINIFNPIINYNPVLDYHSVTNIKTENNFLANFFSVPRTFKTDSLATYVIGMIIAQHPLGRKLRDEGNLRTEYAREVELEGQLIAGFQDSNIVYTAGKAVVDWPTGMKVDILGLLDKQERNVEGRTILQLGRLDFDSSRVTSSRVYKDPNVAFYGINGEEITRNQAPGVPRFCVENCKLKFNR